MGKPKDKPKVTLPKPDEVVEAKPLVEKVVRAKARFGKVREKLGQGGTVNKSDPKHRAAKKRVKRAQRRLRERLEYAATRRPKPAPAAEAGTATAAS